MNLVRFLPSHGFYALLFLAAAQPVLLLAQYQSFEGLTVTNIQFAPKDQPLEPSELHEMLPLRIGQPLRMAEVRASIERLFATGRYADIQVDAEPYRGGVNIRFVTKNSWFIGAISVHGGVANPPNNGQLENAARLDLGQPYTEAKLQAALVSQRQLLEDNGLFRSTLRPVFDYDPTYQQVNIDFAIDSGPRARLAKPALEGDLKMEPDRILAATKFQRWLIHRWKPMTQTRVRQGIDGVRSLYEKENRFEAKISLDSMKYNPATNSAQPTIRIEAGPRIVVRSFGAKLSQKQLRRFIPVYEEHAVDYDLLTEGARNLRNYFQSQGYFDADVQFKEQRMVNDRATIDYLINTGGRHKLVQIRIEGNRYFSVQDIRERMFLQTASFLQFPHGRYSENLVSRDEDSITSLYESNGFRDVKVSHRIEDRYQGKPGDLAVFITIEEGPQYFIQNLEVDGIEGIGKERVMAALSSVAGQPFSDFSVAVDRDTILARYFENGFPNATFEWSSKPAAEPNRVDLRYSITEGKQQFVRQVVTMGLKITHPSLISRNIKLNPGDPLSPARVADIQRSLYELGVFARVTAATQDPDGETDSKYVLYDMEEARRYSMAVGFGAELGRIGGGCQTCLEAPAGAAGFSPRVSLDLSRNNLWGLAHNLSLRTRVSNYDQLGLLTYSMPRFRNSSTLSFSITGMWEHSKDIRTFNSTREEVDLQLSQRLNKTITFFYRYAYRRVAVNNLKITPFLIPQLSQPVRVGITSWNLVQDRRDDPVDPHKGIFNTIDLGLAGHFFGSHVNFTRFLGSNATYTPLGGKWVLARRTQFGIIEPFHYSGNPEDAIPLPERFFGGGSTSQRGFPEEQAGPRDTSTGFPLGGNALLFNQTELRFPLIGANVGGVLYHDMGNIYSSPSAISFRVIQRDLQDFNYMVHAVGFGIRYRTPVGPVRVDLGYSINPPYFFGFKGTQQDLINGGVNPCSPGSPVYNQCVVQNVSHFQFFFSIGQTF